jgi:hypothetical protein
VLVRLPIQVKLHDEALAVAVVEAVKREYAAQIDSVEVLLG